MHLINMIPWVILVGIVGLIIGIILRYLELKGWVGQITYSSIRTGFDYPFYASHLFLLISTLVIIIGIFAT